ncbi:MULTISPECIES: hypothetical protein [Saccharothrix]|uniref:hypothetical protein n=1 Tax=Saccharothrix TaxID=2071 RepID=UPI00093BBF74|nr:hypothetical protein [Saccharothrix sp. CB00851]OKI31965.1 hypothetical protein A6A25_26305 [Saccharothrix sp. CB00851]
MALTFGGLTLRVQRTPAGPRYLTDDPRTEPIAWLVNSFVTGDMPGLPADVAAGRKVSGPMLRAEPADAEHVDRLGGVWLDLTGTELGTDNYLVSMDFTGDQLVVPRQVLVDAVRALDDAARTGDYEADWPPEDVPADAPATTDWWLTPEDDDTPTALAVVESLAAVDSLAASIDALERTGAPADAVDASAKRRLLLTDLDRLGLLAERGFAARRRLLGTWGLDTLLDYNSAGYHLARYATSAAREHAGLAPVAGAPGCAVSVDWFRLGDQPPPPGFTEHSWTAHCEALLAHHPSPEDGGSGELHVRFGAGRLLLRWRTDDGVRPVLVAAAVT